MTFRTLATPVAVVLLTAGLTGCGFMKFSGSKAEEPADPVAAGNAAFERKDFATACRELSKAGPGAGAEILTRAGEACARDGRDKARQSFQAALAAKPEYAPAMEGLGLTALADGDLDRARDLLAGAVKAGDKNAQAALALGDAALLSGQCDKALEAFREAVRRDGSLAAAKARLAAARSLCAASRASAPAPASAPVSSGVSRSVHAPGTELPSVTPPASGTSREPAKAKPAPKTIDLNDI